MYLNMFFDCYTMLIYISHKFITSSSSCDLYASIFVILYYWNLNDYYFNEFKIKKYINLNNDIIRIIIIISLYKSNKYNNV